MNPTVLIQKGKIKLEGAGGGLRLGSPFQRFAFLQTKLSVIQKFWNRNTLNRLLDTSKCYFSVSDCAELFFMKLV